MPLLPITAYGNPLLRKQAESIKEMNSEILTLINDMTETMKAANGVGLAAPQVGVSKQLMLIDWSCLEEEGEVIAYINPEITKISGEVVRSNEGCLSLPQVWADIDRKDRITVRYTTVDGKQVQEELKDYGARVFQHEFDHLIGILFIDRMTAKERATVRDTLKAIMEGAIKPFDGTSPPPPEFDPNK